jgi:hypothetical protein
LPAGFAECGVDGDGEAGGAGAVGVHRPFFCGVVVRVVVCGGPWAGSGGGG